MRRFLPLLILALLTAGLAWFTRDLGWHTLAQHQRDLLGWTESHRFAAYGLYLLSYIVTAALSLPHAALLTVAGGLLFGAVLGTALTVIGATLGAAILLIVLRNAFTHTLSRHRSRIPAGLRDRLARDGFSYLLAVRLLPMFPFWIVNLAASVAGVPLKVFIPATLIGIVPVSFVLSAIGAGVGDVLASGQTPDLSVLFAPRILLPLLALAAVSLLPVFLRRTSSHA